MDDNKISIACNVWHPIAKRYGCIIDRQEYYSAVADEAKAEELSNRAKMAENAQARAEAFVECVRGLDSSIPAIDISCLLRSVHRATQASMVESAIHLLTAFASFSERDVDGRNADAVRLCKDMVAGAFDLQVAEDSVSAWRKNL